MKHKMKTYTSLVTLNLEIDDVKWIYYSLLNLYQHKYVSINRKFQSFYSTAGDRKY